MDYKFCSNCGCSLHHGTKGVLCKRCLKDPEDAFRPHPRETQAPWDEHVRTRKTPRTLKPTSGRDPRWFWR